MEKSPRQARQRLRFAAEPRASRTSQVSTRGYRLWVGGPVPKQADGITIGRTIIVRRRSAASPNFAHLLRHELTHVEQWTRLGAVGFVREYATDYLRGRWRGLSHHDAYLAIGLEQQARLHARLPMVATVAGMSESPLSLTELATFELRLADFVASLTSEELRQTSRLPDWSVGHVIAHLAMNAKAFHRVAQAAMAGTVPAMYDSVDARSADIETHSWRSAADMLALVRESSAEMQASWKELLAQPNHRDLLTRGFARTTSERPDFPLGEVLFRRLREIEVHSTDCGIRRRSIESWSDRYVNADIVAQFLTVPRRTSEAVHVIDEHGSHYATPGAEQAPALHHTRRHLLAWTLDRAQPIGLPTLASWGNPNAWTPEA